MNGRAAAEASLPEALDEKRPLLKNDRNETRSCLSMLLGCSIGPGLLVTLADTDAGGTFTAGQDGAAWGYSFVLWEALMIPLIFVSQDLTARLGVYAKRGLTACIREKFGPVMAWFAAICLVIECIFAVMSELSGIEAVAQLWGADRLYGTFVSAVVLIGILVTLTYRQVEIIGVTLGLATLSFVVSMFMLHPSPAEVIKGCFQFYPEDQQWMLLVAANVGSSVVPWMLFFQQSAVATRSLDGVQDLAKERMLTAVGSFLTQIITIAATVSVAATAGMRKNLDGIQDFVNLMEPGLGHLLSKIVVSAAFLGGSICASFVVVLAPAWAISEASESDARLAMDLSVREAPVFYAIFVGVVMIAVAVLVTGVQLVQLNIYIELLDAMFLPFSLLMVFMIAMTDYLPPKERLAGRYKWILAVIFSLVSAISLVSGISGLI
mmetsp:Transcript_72939/g.129214  ORF Transcript_72939/g.129214 Transcript_72939/m.129214 type:complete len:436 (-) Transcript_72939:103-1410(-)